MSGERPEEALLRAERLSQSYGPTRALREVSLEVRPGEVVALLGVNGAGKSTLMRILCGLRAPSSGRVRARAGAPLRRAVGYCPQELIVWEDLRAREQVEMIAALHGLSRGEASARTATLLADLGLEARARDLAGALSGGMKRRLSIAMAVVHDPQVLVLDEAEVGLDPQSRVRLRAFIARFARDGQRGVLLSTHNIDEVERVADRVVILEAGEVAAAGTPHQLIEGLGEGAVITLHLPASPGRALREELSAHVEAMSEPEAGQLRAISPRPMHALGQWTRALQARGVRPEHLSVNAPRLEDVFLACTGRRLGA